MVTKPDSIIVPIEGNRDSLQKLKTIKTRSSFDGEDYQLLQEELTQLMRFLYICKFKEIQTKGNS